MERNLTPGSQKSIIGLGQISKIPGTTNKKQKQQMNFLPRSTGYFGQNVGMAHQWNISIQNYRHENNM